MARVGEEKVWVEAEKVGDGEVILSLADVRKRRRLFHKYGRHNVITSPHRLNSFPRRFADELARGYPVRFKMYESVYESMLGAAGGAGLGELAAGAPYRWIITKDWIGTDSKGVQGPRGLNPNLKTNRAHFVMKDDDGIVYYEGDIYGDYDGFEPLDDYGMPNAGATSIWYKGKML